MRYAPLAFLALAVAAPAAAQAPTPGSCVLGSAANTLNVNNVSATVYNTGSLFFGGTGEAQYVVPQASGISPMYAAGLWVGGRVGSETRFAGARYNNFQFWPGPLGPNGRPLNSASCAAYDRIYSVSALQVADYDGGATPAPDLAQWPVGLGAKAIDANGDPVPQGTNPARVIDLEAGERPVIYGDQTVFWVMNDVGNQHTGATGNPLGLEVRVHAAAFDRNNALGSATLYRYELVYKGTDALTDVRVSVFTDPDLGNSQDDYVHTDVARGMGVVYNADEDDEGATGYGSPPPAMGVDLLGGLGSTSYFLNSTDPATNDPATTTAYANYQRGLWGDGQVVREGGNGRNTTGAVTSHVFAGDPVTGGFWSEENTGAGRSPLGDRRLVLTAPPLTLAPGSLYTFDFAILYAQGVNRLGSVTALRAASDLAQGLYDSGDLFRPAVFAPLPPPPTAVPNLLAPDDGADLGATEAVMLRWTAVGDTVGIRGYRVEVAADTAFTVGLQRLRAETDTLAFSIPLNSAPQTYYWRVRASNGRTLGPNSAVRRFQAEGAFQSVPADVEEWDAAGPIATNADGSATDPSLLNSLNSTRTRPPGYLVGAQGAASNDPVAVLARLDFNGYLSANAPNEYEIRWVNAADGAAVFNRATGAFMTCYETGTLSSTGSTVSGVTTVTAPVVNGLPRMPFQLWEVRPDGTEQQMVALVLDDDTDGCYGFTTSTAAGSPAGLPYSQTQYERIYGTRVPYDEAALLATPFSVFAQTQIADAEHQAFGRLQVVPYTTGAARPPQAGTRIRLVTSEPVVAPTEPPATGTAALTIWPAQPNPIRGRATLRLTVPTGGPVRAALYDVLGRQVAVLLSGTVAAGTHTVALDASALAPGVYVVVAESGPARASRVVTVAR